MMTIERDFRLSEGARRSLNHSARPARTAPASFTVEMPRWHSTTFGDLTATREFLDRLENAGRTMRELRILDDARFEVRWRDPQPVPAGGRRVPGA